MHQMPIKYVIEMSNKTISRNGAQQDLSSLSILRRLLFLNEDNIFVVSLVYSHRFKLYYHHFNPDEIILAVFVRASLLK